jgi:hypothetical protein
MKQDIKDKWVKALRSGEYKQGTGYLIKSSHDGNQCEHCCLGVLCDLYLHENDAALTWNKEFVEDADGVLEADELYTTEFTVASLYGTEFVLPHQVQEWAGLHEESPAVHLRDGRLRMLSELNDHDGYTFESLATLIEDRF